MLLNEVVVRPSSLYSQFVPSVQYAVAPVDSSCSALRHSQFIPFCRVASYVLRRKAQNAGLAIPTSQFSVHELASLGRQSSKHPAKRCETPGLFRNCIPNVNNGA